LKNVGEAKTCRIVFKLKNVLEQLYSHYAMNVGVSGARPSNEDRNGTSSTSLGMGSGTSYEINLNQDALADYHSFWETRNLMLAWTETEKYYVEDVETPSESFDILMYPVLSLIAQDVLSIPLTTVASKFAFSTRGRVIDCF